MRFALACGEQGTMIPRSIHRRVLLGASEKRKGAQVEQSPPISMAPPWLASADFLFGSQPGFSRGASMDLVIP